MSGFGWTILLSWLWQGKWFLLTLIGIGFLLGIGVGWLVWA